MPVDTMLLFSIIHFKYDDLFIILLGLRLNGFQMISLNAPPLSDLIVISNPYKRFD